LSTAVIYVRQSRNKPGERTVSPEVQEQACRALPGVASCPSVEVFSDLDVSGGKRYRKGYTALVERVKSGDVSVVAFYDSSRIARDNLLSAEFYALMEQRPDIRVEQVEGDFRRGPDGELTWTVQQAAATHLRKMTGRKVAASYAHLNAVGAPTGMPPYGYRRGPDGFEVDEDAAAVVRRIFEDYTAGDTSAKALAARLNDEGVVRNRPRSKHGWLPDTVVDTLRNVAYVGKTYSASRSRRQGELIRAQWGAIVDEPTFRRAQEILNRRRVQRSTAPRSYVFGRLLICAQCGAPMRAARWSGRGYSYSYYHCRRDVGIRCTAPAVREDVLIAWTDALLARINQHGERVSAGDQIARSVALAVIGRDEPKRRPVVRSLTSIETALERLALSWAAGHVSDATYAIERARYESLRAEIASASVPAAPLPDYSRLLSDWRSADRTAQRRTLTRLFEALYVESGEIRHYRPRREHRVEVNGLMEKAMEGGGFEWSAPNVGQDWRARHDGSGKGGLLLRVCRDVGPSAD